MTNSIELSGLCKAYPDFALKNVTLCLPCGSIMGLIGENGAGKTTTIKCILGLIARDDGAITLLGRDSLQDGPALRQDVGVVLDECAFHDSLRPADLNRILAPVYQNWDQELFYSYLIKFSLPEKKRIKEFSRGMKMKLSLAVALAHRPKLLILDEATSGLDPVVRDEILDEFLEFIQDEDHSILLSSHITSDLEKVCDYITYLHQGQVMLSGVKDDILASYGRVACTAAQLEQLAPGEVLRVRRGTYGCEALVENRGQFHLNHPELTVDPASLEDIMLFVGKGEAL